MAMNLWALGYIIEIAKTESISRAAQNLYLSQPHLSNTVKAMEQDLGIRLFDRSAKGMRLTEAGKDFVKRAQAILDEVDEMETMFRVQPEEAAQVRISVTRSYQIHRCVTEFVNRYAAKKDFLLYVKETNPFQVMEDVRTREAELGVLHIFDAQKDYFFSCFKAYSLEYKLHYERRFLVAMSKDNPLAKAEHLTKSMLEDQIVVMYGDYEISEASYKVIMENSGIMMSRKRIYVYDRASAMETLERCPNTYMWIAGLHSDTLKRYGLVLRVCEDVDVRNLGYSIYPSEEGLTKTARELYERMQNVDWTEEVY